ncbi:AhpC/TSA family protein [Sediminitomix flava]|uniref:AhpC/TSA family protein n=2 Tax=Sediminitomix flava TaxID=379075 RepID=A0A315ZBT2_SEDFL|nr:AhpC/TSA family protein [Sediminitomix flava]
MLVLAVSFFAACQAPKTEEAKEEKKEEKTVAMSTEAPAAEGYKIGDVATDFSLKNIDDKMVSLADYPDTKGFVVIFTCNHCPYAKAYEDRIVAFDKAYKEKGYPVIAINPNDPTVQEADSFELMKVRAEEKGFTFPYLMDEGQKIYPQYGAKKTPHVYVLQKEDKGLVVKYIGAIDDNFKDASKVTEKYLENAVNALLEGKEVEVETTKAIGCSIKTAKA